MIGYYGNALCGNGNNCDVLADSGKTSFYAAIAENIDEVPKMTEVFVRNIGEENIRYLREK